MSANDNNMYDPSDEQTRMVNGRQPSNPDYQNMQSQQIVDDYGRNSLNQVNNRRNNTTTLIIIAGVVIVVLIGFFIWYVINTNKKLEEAQNRDYDEDTKVTQVEDVKTQPVENKVVEEVAAPAAPVEKPKVEPKVWPTTGKLYFRGKINGKYAVHIYINTDTDEGQYYYDKNGSANRMNLRIEYYDPASGQLSMTEYNQNWEYCGDWSGRLKNGVYSGNGDYLGKTMPFYVTQCERSNTGF